LPQATVLPVRGVVGSRSGAGKTGSIAPRKRAKFRSRVLAGQEGRLAALITAGPDASTLVGVARRPADDGGAQHTVARH
jgi:hypothetical protein